MSGRWVLVAASLTAASVSFTGCSTVKSLFGDDKKAEATRGIPKKSEAEYFSEAQKHLSKQRYDLAEKLLSDLRTFYPVGENSEQAQLDLVYIKYQQGEFEQAVLAADRFIRLYPTNADVDYAHYVKGVSMMNSGYGGIMKYTQLKQAHRDTSYLRAAFAAFDTLIKRHPESKYTPDAIERMHFIYNQFAEAEMHAARFNLKRGAYVGAAERARWVLQYFPQSPQTPEAIATLAHAYDQLGLTESASKQKALLRANYPQLLSGDTVLLKAARTPASWLNKLTLGVVGRPSAAAQLTSTAQAPAGIIPIPSRGRTAPAALPPAVSTPATDTTGTAPRQAVRPSTNITLGLGLPASDDSTETTPQQP